MILHSRLSIALALALALTGCAGPTAITARTAESAATRAASADRFASEPVPTEAQLARLEYTSPEELIENAPAEPGADDKIGPKPPNEDLGNFGSVDATLWRGARPTEKGLAQLAAKGVKTIVNLENDKGAVEREGAWAAAHGIRFVSLPLSVILPPSNAKVDQFLALANDPAARPLYFHCMQGRDRTGTAAFCYRVRHDGWNFSQAYAEMKGFHFHTYLLGLQAFIRLYPKQHAAS
jgi:hypothetical protein